MAVKNYDAKKISIIFGGKAISGFADGSFVKVTIPDSFEKVVGADGEVARSRSANQAGECELILMQTSKSNDDLSVAYNLDRVAGAGIAPILIRDALGSTLYSSADAWVKKPADASFGKGAGEHRTWILDMGQTEVFVGGA